MREAMKKSLKGGSGMMMKKVAVKAPKNMELMEMAPNISSLTTKQLPVLAKKEIGDECRLEYGVKVSGIREDDDGIKTYEFKVKSIRALSQDYEQKEDKPKSVKNMDEAHSQAKEQYVKTQESHYVG